MKAKFTELAFILDRSGSMGGLEGDTIGGYNAMLAKQRVAAGEARITTVLFDDRYELLHNRADIRSAAPITEREYFVRGSTALLDAIGRTIDTLIRAQRNADREHRAERVIFVITTDGMENASREYDSARVKAMIERQKNRYGWEFLFLGANIDAIETAGRFGIASNRAQNYCADEEGTRLNYRAMSEAVLSFRKCGQVSEHWGDAIQEDFRRRGGQRR